jgi:hypothetical protein
VQSRERSQGAHEGCQTDAHGPRTAGGQHGLPSGLHGSSGQPRESWGEADEDWDEGEVMIKLDKLPSWLAIATLPMMTMGMSSLLSVIGSKDRCIKMNDEDFFDEMDYRYTVICDLYHNRWCQIQDRETDSDALAQCTEHHPTWRLQGLV